MKRFITALFLSLAGFSQLTLANEQAELYDAIAPSDSAFIRILNLSDNTISAALSGKNNAQQIGPQQLGAYRFTPPALTRLEVAGQTATQELKTSTAYTVIFDGNSLTFLEDKFQNEPRKAQVGFYNFSNQNLSLKTADGRHSIVDNIAPGTNGNRLVNELKISFAAFNGDSKVADFPETFLRKSRTYSFVVIPSETGVRTISQANNLDTLD